MGFAQVLGAPGVKRAADYDPVAPFRLGCSPANDGALALNMESNGVLAILVAALAGALCAWPLARVAREMPSALLREWSHEPESVPQAEPLRGLPLGLFTLGCVALPAFAAARHGQGLEAFCMGALACCLWLLAWIDLETRLLPDRLTLGLLWAGLLVNLGGAFAPLDDAVLGAAVGYSSLFLLNAGYRLFRGHDGMGAGDFKLLAALGAWFGVASLPAVLVIAACSGLVVGVGLLLSGRREPGEAIAFGPHLCLGAAVLIYARGRVESLLGLLVP